MDGTGFGTRQARVGSAYYTSTLRVATPPQEPSSSHELQGNAKGHRVPSRAPPYKQSGLAHQGHAPGVVKNHTSKDSNKHKATPIPTCHTSMHTSHR